MRPANPMCPLHPLCSRPSRQHPRGAACCQANSWQSPRRGRPAEVGRRMLVPEEGVKGLWGPGLSRGLRETRMAHSVRSGGTGNTPPCRRDRTRPGQGPTRNPWREQEPLCCWALSLLSLPPLFLYPYTSPSRDRAPNKELSGLYFCPGIPDRRGEVPYAPKARKREAWRG